MKYIATIALSFCFFPIGQSKAELHSSETPDSSDQFPKFEKTWGKSKGFGGGHFREKSRLAGLTNTELNQTADLTQPVKVEILETGVILPGLEEVSDRLILVRLTNQNSYSIFFQGRRGKNYQTIKQRWNNFEHNKWELAGWDWCGTGVRDLDVGANEQIDVLLVLHPQLGKQQILGNFYKTGEISTQSEVLLYESK